MAEKKTTQVKATSKKIEKTLNEQLADARTTLLEAKKSLKAGELVNPRVVTVARKDVARMLTKINQEDSSANNDQLDQEGK